MGRKKYFVMRLKHHYILFPAKDKVKKEHVFLSRPSDFSKKKRFKIITQEKIFK